MDIIEIHINCPDEETAKSISSRLIHSRLAACTNLYHPIQSSYHWQGKVEQETEVALVVKTRSELFEKVSHFVEELHPYETPAIIGHAIKYVNPGYRTGFSRKQQLNRTRSGS